MKKPIAKVHTYEVKPTNFFTLPEDKQTALLSRFYSILASTQEPLQVFLSRKPLRVEIGNETRELQVTRTYMSSTEPLDGILGSQGFEFVASDLPKLEAKKEYWKYVCLKDGRLAKCFTLYRPSSSLSSAWAYNLLSVADAILMEFVPLEQDKAVSKLQRKVHLMRSTMSTNPKIVNQTQAALAMISQLERNTSKLIKVTLDAAILANDKKSLKEKSKQFSKFCNISLSRFDDTPTMQARMLQGWGKGLYVDLGSCDVFYPFVSSDMMETPNGITLGINCDTGGPVIFDYAMRANYNILILASSGEGKSVTAKLLLKRLLERYPSALAFVVDPQGEYEKIAEYLKIEPIRITGSEELGFDPFKMFEKSSDAVDVLCEIVQAPQLVKNSFLAKCENVQSLEAFYGKLSDEEKRYLVSLIEGPIAMLFRGKPKLSDRVIISLKDTQAKEYVAKISFLALAKFWQKASTVSDLVPKILIIDEGHLIFQFASASKFVDSISRMGRKQNIIFIFVSQRVEDVTKTDAGRAFLDNSETKIILRNENLASDELVKTLSLSPMERDMISSFNRGESLILARNYRLHAYIAPSKEELEMFGTSPQNLIHLNNKPPF